MKINKEQSIREILHNHPQTRVIFDRHGLKGCGGTEGPEESLRFFARAHGVELHELLNQLQQVIDDPAQAPAAESATLADSIYRRFFKAGIVLTLSAGAFWGALLLLQIGLSQKFTAVSIFDINAHGHAQIFGWVGLFVMGFAYQAFPRFRQTSLWKPGLAIVSFYLMLSGIVLRVVAEPLHIYWPFFWVGLLASCLEMTAIAIFVIIISRTIRHSQKPLSSYEYYIAAALSWFVLQGLLDFFHLYMTTAALSREELLRQVSSWQAPLRDLQIHGFALTMILGVSQRFMHGIYGFPEIPRRRSLSLLLTLTVAVAGESVFFVLFRHTGQHSYAGLMYGAMLMLAISVAALTHPWWRGLWGTPESLDPDAAADRSDRSFKFIRAAYAWLFVSLGMLLFVPFYNLLTGQTFSHAFYGATRHAITVGFISLMILGVAAKVVPVLNGVDARKLSQLWLPFILVNLGCGLRVSLQVLTDLIPGAFRLIGLSGILELAGIATWGVGLWRVMNATKRRDELSAKDLVRPICVNPEDKVGWILTVAPELLVVFEGFGFTLLRNPLLRQTVARQTSIRKACSLMGVDEASLLAALNKGLKKDPDRAPSLFPIINPGTAQASPQQGGSR